MVRQLLPTPVPALDDAAILDLYAPPRGPMPFVRFNFVGTADGASTHDGASGDLGGDADRRIFALLRRHADTILVGAGTVRAEGYAGELVDAAGRAWRRERGRPPHPGVAVVSGTLDLDPASAFFAQAPVRPLLLTTAPAAERDAGAFADVADVVACGRDGVDPAVVLRELTRRGHRAVHSEGGPSLFGAFQAADLVDSLCLTLSPLLAGGTARRIAEGAEHPLVPLRISALLEEDGALFIDYRRAEERPGG